MYVDDIIVRPSEFSYAYLTLTINVNNVNNVNPPLLLYLHTCIDVYRWRIPLLLSLTFLFQMNSKPISI